MQKKQKKKVDVVLFVITDARGVHLLPIKMKKKSEFGRVFDTFVEALEIKSPDTRFIYEGRRMYRTDTPEILGMVDGAEIMSIIPHVGC